MMQKYQRLWKNYIIFRLYQNNEFGRNYLILHTTRFPIEKLHFLPSINQLLLSTTVQKIVTYSPSLLLASGMLQTKWLNKFVVDLDLEKSAIFRREILSYGKLNSFFQIRCLAIAQKLCEIKAEQNFLVSNSKLNSMYLYYA